MHNDNTLCFYYTCSVGLHTDRHGVKYIWMYLKYLNINTFMLSNTITLLYTLYKPIFLKVKHTHVNCIHMYLFSMKGQSVQWLYNIIYYISLEIK